MLYNILFSTFLVYNMLYNKKKSIEHVIYTPREHKPVVGMSYITIFQVV